MATKKLPAPTVQPANPDELQLAQIGASVTAFLARLGEFFKTANELEVAAKMTLERAQAWKQPTTLAEDEALKADVREVAAQLKSAEEHWSITTAVSAFHKRLTARRNVTTDALERARKIGTDLHTQYDAAERRRVAEENRRRQEEAERQAREAREREAAALEQAAVLAEEASADLSEREQRFVDLFVSGPHAGQGQRCAEVAGFKDGFKSSARLLSLPKIQMAIKSKQQAAQIRRQAAAVRERPVESTYQPVQAQVDTKGDRLTHGVDLLDESALIEASIEGRVPRDLLQINPKKLADYAKQLGPRIGTWPGCQYRSKTAVV